MLFHIHDHIVYGIRRSIDHLGNDNPKGAHMASPFTAP